MQETIVISLVAISSLSMLCQMISWWVKIPSILFLLMTGLIVGPLTGIVEPNTLLGNLLYPIISLSVAIILFEGSLSLRFKEISEQKNYIIRFISIGGLITFALVSIVTYYIFEIDPNIALLIGAILTVTGPTVIAPMLQVIRPSKKVCEVAKWEGIVLDPFGAILTVLVFDIVISEKSISIFTHGLSYFIMMTGTGFIIGLIFGYIVSEILKKHLIPKFLINIAVLNFVLIAFIIANMFFYETGLLAVTIMGMTMANSEDLDLTDIIEFKETLSTLLISGLFIILAARIDINTLYPLVVPSLILFMAMLLIIRPFKVFLTTFKSDLSLADKAMLVWIAPRGIVAVAIASLFELKLNTIGYSETNVLTPVIFLIIVWSVILPSLTGKFLAKSLGSVQPERNGILILGANPLSINIAKELINNKLDVLLLDKSYDDVSRARMSGIKSFCSNLASLDTDYNSYIQNIGKMLSITPNAEYAALASLHFKREIEKKDMFYLQTDINSKNIDHNRLKKIDRDKKVSNQHAAYERLYNMLNNGYEVKSTTLTEKFTYDHYLKLNAGECILLFAIDPQSNFYILALDASIKPKANWVIISIINKNKHSS